MQKLIIAATLFILTTTYSQAQIFNNVGIKSGVSISSQDWDYKTTNTDLGTESRTGIYIGVTTEILKAKYFSLMADLGYIQKGMQFDVSVATENNPEGTDESKTLDNRYDFISFQPVAKFRLPGKHFEPYLFAGPRTDFYVGFSTNDEFGIELDDVAPVTFGASYGIGLDYTFSDIIITLEAQHQPDFTYLYNQKPSPQHGGLSVQNQAFLVTLGVKYVLN
ncbi:outer membrane beta-barrel protein [Owenweeksia hongkongensis]|uniref:outer membrane beta-barrel protein n=1 Tax=Owenweeksia hongkongensis TaxID=253245 RepID=UPI003A8F6DAE